MNQWQTSAPSRKQFDLVMDDTAAKHDITKCQILQYYFANVKRKLTKTNVHLLFLNFARQGW